jgi:hypothetical protein
MSDLRRGEQLRGAVGAGGDARPTSDADGGVHRRFGGLLRDGDQVGFGRAAGVDADEPAGLDDPIEGAAVDHQVLETGKPAARHGSTTITSPSLK